MADSTIGKAYVQIIPSAEGITGRLNELLGTSSYEAGKSAGANLGTGLLSALTEFGGKITGLMSGIVSEIGDMVNKSFSELSNVAAYGDNIDKMSQKMGMSAEAYQEWDAVMQHSGTSMEAMKSSISSWVVICWGLSVIKSRPLPVASLYRSKTCMVKARWLGCRQKPSLVVSTLRYCG